GVSVHDSAVKKERSSLALLTRSHTTPYSLVTFGKLPVGFCSPNNNGNLYPASVSILLIFDVSPIGEIAIALLAREAQLFVGWVAGVGFHPPTPPTLILYLIPLTHLQDFPHPW
ncbi:hypothetical protein, partial [Cylindrospermopsis raciborskii]|uniref:hypothetical protein n=1 Tax=Cylindrospermopsis raciborskii TaxID=77022 RepID=UPI001F0D0EEA